MDAQIQKKRKHEDDCENKFESKMKSAYRVQLFYIF